jgi:hypothetical protein
MHKKIQQGVSIFLCEQRDLNGKMRSEWIFFFPMFFLRETKGMYSADSQGHLCDKYLSQAFTTKARLCKTSSICKTEADGTPTMFVSLPLL